MTVLKTRYDHLNREELLSLLLRRDAERKFGLIWEQSATEHERALNDDFVALNLDASLSVGTAPYRNLVIEGDNFDALRALNLTHRGQIKCIYIDPPYNTGNQDFVYNDKYVDKDDTYRHSTWLEFMFQRLMLTKDLLKQDGVVLVSIDDNEMAPLSLLLDQVFPGGKVGTFVWRRRSGSNDVPDHFVSVDHEYVLCYANPDFSFAGVGKDLSGYKEVDADHPDPWKRGDLSKPHDYRARPGGFYPIHNPTQDVWYPPNPKRVWAFASEQLIREGQKLRRDTMEALVRAGRIVFPGNDQTVVYSTLEELRDAIEAGTAPRYLQLGLFSTPEEEHQYLAFYVGKRLGFGTPGYKRYRSEVKNASKPISTWISGLKDKDKKEKDEQGTQEQVTLLRTGLNADGTTLLGQMFHTAGVSFSYPKPLSLVQTLIEQATGPDDTVLDFFAGSGTTGHAVLALNASEELSDRRFVLVSSTEATQQDPDKNLCASVTRERVKRAIEGYTYRGRNGNVHVEGLGGDFTYLRTVRIPRQHVLTGLQHHQIWSALQLMQTATLEQFDPETSIQQVWTERHGLLYLTHIDSSVLTRVKELAWQAQRPVTLYTWQPALVEHHVMLDHVTVLNISEALLERFGGYL